MGSISPPSPTSQPSTSHPPSFLVIGAGSRGNSYARAVAASTIGQIGAVAEIDPFKRREFGRKYVWGTDRKPRVGEEFAGWTHFIDWETERRQNQTQHQDYVPITGVFICTLDETHKEIVCALAPLGLHILCEKPLALSLSDCLSMRRSLEQHPPRIVSIGHVLRYSPHNILLRNLLVEQQVIGEIISIEHTEPIGHWHFAHSYVRGNWRRSHEEGVGSLLTKSCHDIDFLMWLLCSSSPLTGNSPHEPSSITSTGRLTTFRKARKPVAAGNATNCLSCPLQNSCTYSATRLYRDRWLRKEKDTGWPLKIIMPEIEDTVTTSGWDVAEQKLMHKLSEDYDTNTSDEQIAKRGWYGRCVYDSDNDVCDEQTVTITWDEDTSATSTTHSDKPAGFGRNPKIALFHMTYPTIAQCERRGRVYGSEGEILYDSKTITVQTFATGETTSHVIPKQPPEVEKSHGGGDWGLAGRFVDAVIAANQGVPVQEAQRMYVGCDLEEIVRSHAVVFAAESARIERTRVDWDEWWQVQKDKFGLK